MEKFLYQPPTIESLDKINPEGDRVYLKKWLPEKGFGFVRLRDVDIYFNKYAVCKDLIKSNFSEPIYAVGVHSQSRGLSAERVCCAKCATPGHVEFYDTEETEGGHTKVAVRMQKDVHPDVYRVAKELEREINVPYNKEHSKKIMWDAIVDSSGNLNLSQAMSSFGDPISITREDDGRYKVVFQRGEKFVNKVSLPGAIPADWKIRFEKQGPFGDSGLFRVEKYPDLVLERPLFIQGYYVERLGGSAISPTENFNILTDAQKKEVLANFANRFPLEKPDVAAAQVLKKFLNYTEDEIKSTRERYRAFSMYDDPKPADYVVESVTQHGHTGDDWSRWIGGGSNNVDYSSSYSSYPGLGLGSYRTLNTIKRRFESDWFEEGEKKNRFVFKIPNRFLSDKKMNSSIEEVYEEMKKDVTREYNGIKTGEFFISGIYEKNEKPSRELYGGDVVNSWLKDFDVELRKLVKNKVESILSEDEDYIIEKLLKDDEEEKSVEQALSAQQEREAKKERLRIEEEKKEQEERLAAYEQAKRLERDARAARVGMKAEDLGPAETEEERAKIARGEEVMRINAFAEKIIELAGIEFGCTVLSNALDANYGAGSRKNDVFRSIEGLEDTDSGRQFKNLERAKDIDDWIQVSLTYLQDKKAGSEKKDKKPEVSGTTLADLMKKFSKG